MRSILGVEEVGGEVKGRKRFGLGVVITGDGLGGIFVVTRGELLLGPRASIINWRNYVAFMEVRTSSVVFSKANVREGRDVGKDNDAGVATLGGVRLYTLRLSTGTEMLESTLYGRRSEKSRDKVVEGKR